MAIKSESEAMQELASLMWSRFLRERVHDELTHGLTGYKAEVVSNNGDGTLTVKRPFDSSTLTLKCAASLNSATAGDQVLIVGMGDKSTALSNAFVLCKTNLSNFSDVPLPYTSNPSMDGVASPGVNDQYARGDHVHPSDTSRIPTSEKGAANGVAELDANGVVPTSQLPAFTQVFIDTESGWNSQTTLIAQDGAIYIYTDHGTAEVGGTTVPVPGIKIGDGTSYLIDMAFVAEDIAQKLQEHISNTTVHITSAERQEWNDKVTCYMSTQDTECLVFEETTTP